MGHPDAESWEMVQWKAEDSDVVEELPISMMKNRLCYKAWKMSVAG
jgi:hypothetical protein